MEKLALEAIKNNTLESGAIVAAASGPSAHGHDEYKHVWPRDALLVAIELSNHSPTHALKIYSFISKLPRDRGLFFQRYELNGRPDDRAWCNAHGRRQLDQDALFLLATYKLSPFKKIDALCTVKALLKAIHSKQASTDVWEQKQGYFFYTTCALIAGLRAAKKLFHEFPELSKTIFELEGSIESFYDLELKSFVKSPSEKVIDLEVLLGLNLLLESGSPLARGKEFVERSISTLSNLEGELVVFVKGAGIPLRYQGDFWNGEVVGDAGIGRPWPMGSALLSQTYSLLTKAAKENGLNKAAEYCFVKSGAWLSQAKQIPGMEWFPEQVDFDGSIPFNSPKPLSWCASEYLKANRLQEKLWQENASLKQR